MAAAGMIGCTSDPASQDTTTGNVLVEVEYINYAWGRDYFGFFLNGQGEVYKYDRKGSAWTAQDSTVFSAVALEEKYASRTLLQTRAASEVGGVESKVGTLTPSLSGEKHQCADAGTLTYWAYKYDGSTARYTRYLLRREGDVAQQNTSAAAQDLITYIRSLGLIQEFIGCDP